MKKALLALSAALLFALPSFATPQAQGPGTGPEKGPIKGHWDLPDFTGPGHFRGKLSAPKRNVDLFRIVGELERKPGSSEGRMRGRAVLLVGPQAGKEFDVVGRWDASSPGQGAWRAKIVRPNQGNQNRKPLIEMRGQFRDPNIVGPGGKFAGAWKDPS